MKIHVLGYWGTYPAPGEATTGFLVETERAKVLIDCGSGVLSQLFKVCDIPDLSAVIVTHHHHDHTADLGTLGYAVLLSRITNQRTCKLPVYMPAGNPAVEEEFQSEPLIDWVRIVEGSQVLIEDLEVSFARTRHAVYCLALRMVSQGKTFVFSADSSYCQSLVEIARGADLFLCETSMYAQQVHEAEQTGHLTAEQAGRLAKEAGAARLVITHYPHYGDVKQLGEQASAAFGKPVEMVSTLQQFEV
jgi:ribonuclease BN (tRNA processing enzyme)